MKNRLTIVFVIIVVGLIGLTVTQLPKFLATSQTDSVLIQHLLQPQNTKIIEDNDDVPGSWMATVQQRLVDQEYHVSRNDKGLQAPNRRHNLRTYFSRQGIVVEPRGSLQPMPILAMSFAGITRQGIKDEVSDQMVAADQLFYHDNKVTLLHSGGVNEWYINDSKGLEHGFDLKQRIPGSGQLVLAINVAVGEVLQHGDDIRVKLADGRLLDYNKLKVFDANNQSLPAAMVKVAANQLAILFDDEDAVYPLVVDPLLTSTADTQLQQDQASAGFGWQVKSAGDVNGDGFGDVIVGAIYFDNGQSNEGAAFVYHGSASGLGASAAAQLESNQADAQFGTGVSGAGDVNGDGYDDVIVGAYFYDNGQSNEGAAFIYHGSASGVNTVVDAFLESDQATSLMGYSVAAAGDVNGDGYGDVVVGIHEYDNGQADEGRVHVYHGSASGVDSIPDTVLESNQATAYLGISVAGAGDVNADGYADIIVGAEEFDNGQSNEGAAFVYLGSASGISTTISSQLEENQTASNFSFHVVGVGDVNGDGYADVLVTADTFDNGETNEGQVFIYHGSGSGVSTTASSQLQVNQASAQFGSSAFAAGDVNGDGYADVIVGADLYDNGETDEGAAFVYYGSSTGIANTAAIQLESDQANAGFGRTVAGAGDINGDGYADILVGAYLYDNGQTDEGNVFVYHGGAEGILSTIHKQLESDQDNANYGYSVAGAGDVNSDGYGDIIIGAHSYDSGETDEGAAFIFHGSATGIGNSADTQLQSNQTSANLGYSVKAAGDVNGDGYDDVIVGVLSYDEGQTNEGGAFIYHGSALGVATTAAVKLQSDQAEALMGYSVSGAGDVNGDGYDDVIVGAYQYDDGQTDEGAAFVYHGGVSGVSAVAVTVLERDQANALLGQSVSAAGDVNGDGFDDVVVGARLYDNGQTDEGAVFVHHGSASGINTAIAAQLEGDQASAWFGFDVAGAGDVNGDGYGDVIVGANQFDNGQTEEGRLFVYHGSGAGINSTAVSEMEINQANTWLGFSVDSAGDVNGDGYGDVIAGGFAYSNGHSEEGVVLVYHGSAAGISTTAASQLEINQASARLGVGAAGAGDVNGDGYSDIVAGAYRYSNGNSQEGAAFVYLGNSLGRPRLRSEEHTSELQSRL